MISKVWVVSELYHPEETSTGHFLTGIAEGLAQRFSVNVLCVQPTYSSRGVRAPKFETRNGVHIYRCSPISLDKDRTLFRFTNLVSISLSIFVQGVRRFEQKDTVLVVTNPPLLPFLIALACRLKGAKFLLLIHDVYPEVLVATKFISPKAFLNRLIAWISRRLYLSAARIIVLGRDMKKIVSEKLSSNAPPIVIIPNWGDLDDVVPQERSNNTLLERLGIDDKFVIQYSGNMGRTHGIEVILKVARQLLSQDSQDPGLRLACSEEKQRRMGKLQENLHFLFIGWGAKRRWLEKEMELHQLANVTIMDFVPREQLVTSLNSCDVAIISFLPGMCGVSVPSRMYNVMAAGKPVIAVADKNSELALVVKEEKIGWVVPPDQPDKLIDVIMEAQADPEELAAMGTRARWAVENKYSREHVITSYLNLVQEVNDGHE